MIQRRPPAPNVRGEIAPRMSRLYRKRGVNAACVNSATRYRARAHSARNLKPAVAGRAGRLRWKRGKNAAAGNSGIRRPQPVPSSLTVRRIAA